MVWVGICHDGRTQLRILAMLLHVHTFEYSSFHLFFKFDIFF
jgi:hypothetical protein